METEADLEDEGGPKSVEMPSFEDEEKKSGCSVGMLAFIALALIIGALLVPNFIRARSRGQLTACKSNLKNIGTGLEMYSTDWSGKYPLSLGQLTPNYLKTIPECPSAGKMTYEYRTGAGVAYNTGNPPFENYYFVFCSGDSHTAVSVPEGYPQYDAIQGLLER